MLISGKIFKPNLKTNFNEELKRNKTKLYKIIQILKIYLFFILKSQIFYFNVINFKKREPR